MDKCECLNKGGKWKNKTCIIDKKKRWKLFLKYSLAGIVLMVILLLINYITGKDLMWLAIFSIGIAIPILYYGKKDRQLFIACGAVAMFVDLAYEISGTNAERWSYVSDWMIPFTQVPVSVPVVYFSLGIMFCSFVKFIDKYLN